jgi:hypothetical protein
MKGDLWQTFMLFPHGHLPSTNAYLFILQDAAQLLVKQDGSIPVRLRGLIQARTS